MKWKTVKELLDQKGRGVVTIEPSISAAACAQHMSQRSVGSSLVVEDGRLSGIVTWHDILRIAGEQPDKLRALEVRELMSRELKTTTEEALLDEVEAMMIQSNIRHVPVMKEDRVVGLVTRLDVLSRYMPEEASKEAVDAFIWGAIV